MDEEEREDRIIQERKFKMGFGIEIDDIKIQEQQIEEGGSVEDLDEALGDFFDPFEKVKSNSPGIIQKDGTIIKAPERDVVTEISVEGERRVHWGIMASMVFVYSAISIQVGGTFDPNIAIILLLLLSGFGFWLGEIWVPKEKMNLLGVTWVIISMKVLYGLAIELRTWNIVGVESLGLILIFLVLVNLYIAYRHDHDAIAAQSTLVLLAIGSTIGSELGEEGVAGMIFLSTILLHGLAIHRESGNLAALGIASSNLWVGMHAITNGFKIGELNILALDSPLLLFFLLMSITGLNAAMAAKFAKKENWFSTAFEISGLGKPGLWGVSISLGMIGALLSVASNREDLGFALGMVTFLCAAFGGSYLKVRGVKSERIIKPIFLSLPFLTIILIFGEQINTIISLDGYDIFTILGTILTGYIILRDQNNVSDRVLWIGSVVILILLILLVPAKSTYLEGDGGVLLLILLSILHIGTALLSIKRNSPALAGVTVILPWTWIVMAKILEEVIQTIFIVNDISDLRNFIELESLPLVMYFSLSLLLMVVVNIKLGNTNINLASKFLGLTEISATIKNSEILQLWSIGLWLPIITIITMAQLSELNAISLLFILTLLIIIHIIAEISDYRIGDANNLLIIITVSIMILQWRHGLDQFLMLLVCISILAIISRNKTDEQISTGMLLMGMPILISLSRRKIGNILEESELLTNMDISWVAVICTSILIGVYLPKAERLEKILKPTLASLFLMIVTISITWESDVLMPKYISLGIFILASIWLVSRGEIRAELRTMALRDSRITLATNRQSEQKEMYEDTSTDRNMILENMDNNTKISSYDPLIASLNEKRDKSREKGNADNLEELYTSDISHRPVIILTMLGVVFIAASAMGLVSGPNPIVLLIVGVFVTILVGIARYRSKYLDIDLPHIMGMEMPIAMAICGLVIIHNISHIGPLSSNSDLLDMAILSILIMQLVIISITYQENLIDRIPIAIDWFVIPLFISRIIGAIMNESLPFPLTVNPFIGDNSLEGTLQWSFPWFLLEFLLIMALICDFWIVNKRSFGRKQEDKSPNAGIRNLAIVILSFGPAGILAVLSTIRQGYLSKQPNTVGMGILCGILAIFAISSWSENVILFSEIILFLGISLLILCSLTIKFRGERWTMMLAIDSHILIITGIMGMMYFNQIYSTILILSMSTVMWVVGILQVRRIFRIWGLVDLIMAILLSLIFVSGIFDPTNLLICLTVLAIELGVIGWLGILNEKELLKD